jgi:ubiquinone/menaquinone biosynthesis C-methylase UbiE
MEGIMSIKSSRYIPALSFGWLTPLYDPILKWGMREEIFKQRLVQRANLQPNMDVLDLGCGTGTLTVMLKQAAPLANITGVDGDPQVLSIAQSKAEQANLSIRWAKGMAFDLPYPDHSFDVVTSSLVIHHLTAPDKFRAFQEVRRVLRPGGYLHIVDFGPPFSLLTCIQGALMKNLEETADNFAGHILPLLKKAGFQAQVEAQMNTIFGPLAFYAAHNFGG